MSDRLKVGVGARLSTDGTAVALDWDQNGQKMTTILPIALIPTVLDMLLGAAEKSAERLKSKPTPPRPKLDRIYHPSDLQLIAPDDGSDWVLRISLGEMKMDFALSRQHAQSLQKAIASSPQASKTPRSDA